MKEVKHQRAQQIYRWVKIRLSLEEAIEALKLDHRKAWTSPHRLLALKMTLLTMTLHFSLSLTIRLYEEMGWTWPPNYRSRFYRKGREPHEENQR